MRIGIDGRFLGHRDGLARYTEELARGLSETAPGHEFVIFVKEERVGEFPQLPNFEVRSTTTRHYSLAEQLKFGTELRRAKLDLMHFVNFNVPVVYRAPYVVTIHDLTLLEHAGRKRLWRLMVPAMRVVVRSAIRHSRKIIAISQLQSRLIHKNFGAPRDKIEVVYNSVDPRFRPVPQEEAAAFRKERGLQQPFIMYAGQWREHKNLVRLLKAFRTVRESVDAKLVLVGKIDPAFPIIPEKVKALDLADDVVLTDYVPDDELRLYYATADVFAFPSLVEGFGFPPLEAMASGTAVAASCADPMPEVLGEAALFFDPYSETEMVEALLRLLADSELRAEYQRRGLIQAARYSWEETVRRTVSVYESILPELRR